METLVDRGDSERSCSCRCAPETERANWDEEGRLSLWLGQGLAARQSAAMSVSQSVSQRGCSGEAAAEDSTRSLAGVSLGNKHCSACSTLARKRTRGLERCSFLTNVYLLIFFNFNIYICVLKCFFLSKFRTEMRMHCHHKE